MHRYCAGVSLPHYEAITSDRVQRERVGVKKVKAGIKVVLEVGRLVDPNPKVPTYTSQENNLEIQTFPLHVFF